MRGGEGGLSEAVLGADEMRTPASFSSSSFAQVRDCFPRFIAISRLRDWIIGLFTARKLCSLALRARCQNVLETSQEAGIKFGRMMLQQPTARNQYESWMGLGKKGRIFM